MWKIYEESMWRPYILYIGCFLWLWTRWKVSYKNIWKIYEEPSPSFARRICSFSLLNKTHSLAPYNAIESMETYCNGPPLIQCHWIGFAQPDWNKEKHMMNGPIKTVTNIYQYITWGIRDLSNWVLNYVICFESFFLQGRLQ